jgi:predicted RNA binding protein YcfA (HicA-like mRNA interferase family)
MESIIKLGIAVKVAELIALLRRDGWVQVRMKGSHRQFHQAGLKK